VGDFFQELVEGAGHFRSRQLGEELMEFVEKDGKGFSAGLVSEGAGQVGFAGSGRPEQDDAVTAADEGAGCQFSQQGFAEIGREREVEVFEGLLAGEASGFDEPLHFSLFSGFQFILQQQRQKSLVVEFVLL